MKKCPFCAEEIQDEAIKCKHCKSNIGDKKTENNTQTANSHIDFKNITKEEAIRLWKASPNDKRSWGEVASDWEKVNSKAPLGTKEIEVKNNNARPSSNQLGERFLAQVRKIKIEEPKKLTWLWWTLGVIIFLVFIGSCSDNSPKELGIKTVLSPYYSRLFGKPRKDYLYKLHHMGIKQKVKDGYLIGPSQYFHDESDSDCQTAFLYNKGTKNEDEDFSDGYSVTRYWVRYVGTYRYQGKKMFAFRVYPDKEGYDNILRDPDEVSGAPIDKSPSDMEISNNMAVANFMCHVPGTPPEKNILYSLNTTEVMQSAPGGVLVRINTIMGPSSPSDVAFIYTNENFVDGAILNGRYAYYVGVYKYQTVLGSEKNVYAFRLK